MDIIEKKNEEEKMVEQLIVDFEKKINMFFEFIPQSEFGNNLIAKMRDIGTMFSEDEVLADFEKIYKRFILLNKKKVGEFFIVETKDILDKLYEDFEEKVINK